MTLETVAVFSPFFVGQDRYKDIFSKHRYWIVKSVSPVLNREIGIARDFRFEASLQSCITSKKLQLAVKCAKFSK